MRRAAGIEIRLVVAFVTVAVALVPGVADSHGGGLDGLGCHHNRAAGGYHCHRGALAGQSFASKVEAERALQGVREPLPQATPAPSRPAPAAVELAGRASVVDGDTLEIHGQRIRLHGIDAPESAQVCLAENKSWRCGQQAALALDEKIAKRPVACAQKDRDRYGRIVAVCKAGNDNLNAWLVAEGWSLAYRQYSTDYVGEEGAARAARKGIWRGEFVPPWEWRQGKRLAAEAVTTGDCRIKGNISSKGERIYHVPGGRYYNQTQIDSAKGERLFCSEAEAQAAGWRRSTQ